MRMSRFLGVAALVAVLTACPAPPTGGPFVTEAEFDAYKLGLHEWVESVHEWIVWINANIDDICSECGPPDLPPDPPPNGEWGA